jgi:hypothetical protein
MLCIYNEVRKEIIFDSAVSYHTLKLYILSCNNFNKIIFRLEYLYTNITNLQEWLRYELSILSGVSIFQKFILTEIPNHLIWSYGFSMFPKY